MTILFFAACLCFSFFAHRALLSFRVFKSRQTAAAVSGVLSILISFWFKPISLEGHWWLVSATAAHLYFHFFNMSETARRIKLLMQIESGHTSQTSYSPEIIFDKRIQRLVDLGVVTRCGETLSLKNKMIAACSALVTRYEVFLFPERRDSLR